MHNAVRVQEQIIELVFTMACLCRVLLAVVLVHSTHCFSTKDELFMARFITSELKIASLASYSSFVQLYTERDQTGMTCVLSD